MNASELRSVFHDIISSQYRFPISAHVALSTATYAFRTIDPTYADLFDLVYADDCAFAGAQHYDMIMHVGPLVDCFVKTVYNRYTEAFVSHTKDEIARYAHLISMHVRTYAYYHFVAALTASVLEEQFGRESLFTSCFKKPELKEMMHNAYDDLIDLFDARLRRVIFYNIAEDISSVNPWSIRPYTDVSDLTNRWNLKITQLPVLPKSKVVVFINNNLYNMSGDAVGTYTTTTQLPTSTAFITCLSEDNTMTVLATVKQWSSSSKQNTDDVAHVNIETFDDRNLEPFYGSLYIYDPECYFNKLTLFTA